MEIRNMKEYDSVKLTVEKEKYAKEGVHKGMIGWICDERIINEQRLVCFDGGEVSPFPILPIKRIRFRSRMGIARKASRRQSSFFVGTVQKRRHCKRIARRIDCQVGK